MRKKHLLLFLLIFTFFIPSTSFSDKIENKVNIPKTEIKKLRKELESKGVSKEDQEVLINKFKKGEPWDSMKEEYRDWRPTYTYEKTVYPDGSFNIVEVGDVPEEFVNRNNINPFNIDLSLKDLLLTIALAIGGIFLIFLIFLIPIGLFICIIIKIYYKMKEKHLNKMLE